jgi:hypothetical protein
MDVSKFIWHFAFCVYTCGLIHFILEKGGRTHRLALFGARLDSNLLRLAECFDSLSLWVSLPLAIWLSSGWLALLAHWQVIFRSSLLLEETQPALANFESRPLQ